MTNTLAYLVRDLMTDKKRFVTQIPELFRVCLNIWDCLPVLGLPDPGWQALLVSGKTPGEESQRFVPHDLGQLS